MASYSESFGPAEITCPYCGETVEVDAGPTKLCEITHCEDEKWIIVDLEAGTAGFSSKGVGV